MEVRCASCNKLFRVSDDKITGIGIKFACSRCQNVVKITREEFEQYSLSAANLQDALSAAPSPVAAPQPTSTAVASAAMAAPVPASPRPASAGEPGNGSASSAASAVQNKPAPKPEQKPVSAQAKPEIKAAPRPRPEPAASAVRPSASPAAAVSAVSISPAQEPVSASVAFEEFTSPTAGSSNNKMVVIVVALIVLVGAGIGVKSYLSKSAGQTTEAVRVITSPDGLQVQNAAGTIDQTNQDLIITGVVENTTDKPRPAWYIIVEVYDAQNALLTKGRLLSGKQLYSRHDFEILTKRGANIQDLRMKSLEQGVTIPPKGSVNFEIRLMEPPVGIASFNVTLQPFDPVQLFKEIAEEQK